MNPTSGTDLNGDDLETPIGADVRFHFLRRSVCIQQPTPSNARLCPVHTPDVISLMARRLSWFLIFGKPPAYAKDVKIIQLDIAPEEMGHNKATEVALVGEGKAIVGQLNRALDDRQWFHPNDTPWRKAI